MLGVLEPEAVGDLAHRVVGVEKLVPVSSFKRLLRYAPDMSMWSPPHSATVETSKTRCFSCRKYALSMSWNFATWSFFRLVRV